MGADLVLVTAILGFFLKTYSSEAPKVYFFLGVKMFETEKYVQN